jgi:acyl-CoA synthetase (AMP-forming)/AMP-acid ligase II/1-acyl-sn-glycerol-3-phosphate acyltransferase/acyl carrier protein
MKTLLSLIFACVLRLRYRIFIDGLKTVKKNSEQDDRPILFLPNHQALIDPVLVMSLLYRSFAPKPLADAQQTSQPLVQRLMDWLEAIRIPDVKVSGKQVREEVFAGIEEVIAALKRGEHILLYPAGQICRGPIEVIGGNSGAATVIQAVPEVRIVLVRIRGLWGSRFSRAQGIPSLFRDWPRLLLTLLLNGIVCMPRRRVSLLFVEPDNFPRRGSKKEINSYLEEFYNQDAEKQSIVPLYWWQGSTPIHPDETQPEFISQDTSTIPERTRRLVLNKLKELSGIEKIQEEDKLAADLGLDSLVLAEFGAWLQQEFGLAAENLEVLHTVADCILAAGGIMPTLAGTRLRPVSAAWFSQEETARPLQIPAGETIAEVFLAQAKKHPDQVILSDQLRGDASWRKIIRAIFALLPEIKQLPGQRLGIMLPASVTGAITWLTVLFSGKEPIMVNWTTMQYSLDRLGVQQVLTARALTAKLSAQGVQLNQVGVTWVYLEDIAAGLGLGRKLAALVKSRLSWRQLRKAQPAENAAILFTSGSEARPKAVPLSHANFLANLRDFNQVLSLKSTDKLLGILPIFHSLGLAGTVILPLCAGLRTVYWPNPTEGPLLARMIHAYKTSLLLSTPSFLSGILRSSRPEQLASLRLVFTGAEKCPEQLFTALQEYCPQAVLCEGYGVTECSPVISVNSPEAPEAGTLGKPLPSMQYLIVHPESGEAVAPGETGRLLVRGPNVFSGYLGEAPSPFVAAEGLTWYDTGDLVCERRGVLVFVGRLKRFVKLAGEMVSLPAIEQVLEAHYAPTAEEGQILAVMAMEQADQQPELILVITRASQREEVNQALRTAGLSPLHNIRRVQQVESIPLLGSGKIDYPSIQCLLQEVPKKI